MSDEQVLRLLLMAIDSHELDGDEQKLQRAAAEARRQLRNEHDVPHEEAEVDLWPDFDAFADFAVANPGLGFDAESFDDYERWTDSFSAIQHWQDETRRLSE